MIFKIFTFLHLFYFFLKIKLIAELVLIGMMIFSNQFYSKYNFGNYEYINDHISQNL